MIFRDPRSLRAVYRGIVAGFWLVCEASEGIGSQPVPPCLRYTRIGGSLCRQLSQLVYTLYPFVYIISSFTEEETRTMLIPSPIDCIPYQLVTA